MHSPNKQLDYKQSRIKQVEVHQLELITVQLN